ncbi:SLC13 family permease [soil metagenome]
MSLQIVIVLIVLALAIFLFVTEKLRVDVIALLVMSILLVSGIITPTQGLAGFSNTATVTVAAMFILSQGLFKTGAVNFIGTFVNRIFKRGFWIGIISVMILVGFMSAFINNTPVIAIFLPIILGVAKDTGLSASKMLMPISFASMIGGLCTLIGTSTNILIGSIAAEQGIAPFTMFEFAPLGIVMFVVALIYLSLVGIRLIPDRRVKGDLSESFAMAEYITEIVILEDSISAGKKIREAPLVRDVDISILEIRRGSETIHQPGPNTVLLADDLLIVRCDLESIRAMQEQEGVELRPQIKWGDKSLTPEDFRLLEVVLDVNSSLAGQSLRRAGLRENFGATVLAIRQKGRLIHAKLSDRILNAGDLLLVEIHQERLPAFIRSGDFIITSESNKVEFRKSKVAISVAIVVGVVAAASLNFAPIVVAAVIGAVLMVLLGCLTMEESYTAIDWKIIFLLAGILSLGVALDTSGAAALIASNVVSSVGSFGNIALVSVFYVMTVLLTSAMSNNATGALLAPIAIATAASVGVDPRPFLMAIVFAASASFMTPIGYQTNTMIYGPGQYKFIDFIKVGTPLNFILWIIATILIPIIWPFHP